MVIISANQSKWNNAKGPIRTQGKNRQTAPCAGKTRVTKSCLVLVLHLSGWMGGVSFFWTNQEARCNKAKVVLEYVRN